MLNADAAIVEAIFDRLSAAIDAVPEDKERLFLAKLAFLACREVADPQRVDDLIEIARRALERED